MTLDGAKTLRRVAQAALRAAARRYARASGEVGEAPDEEAELETQAINFAFYSSEVTRLEREAELAST